MKHPVIIWLENHNQPQKWLAEKIGLSEAALSKMLAGKTVSRAAILLKIEAVTHVPVSDMLVWREKSVR